MIKYKKIIYVNCGKRDKYGSDLRSIEHYLSSSEIRPEKKSEYLHKVSDVHRNKYLMQCQEVIYADGNRSLIHQRQLSLWYNPTKSSVVPSKKRLTC